MRIIIVILSVLIFAKTLSYGIYELKEKNKPGGITIIGLAILSLILPNVIVFIRGI